ncbi:DNA repair protein RecO [bacterium]|jgi:DNA repair protein RecO|nr:DNA repair protein RecO [bacterium]
MSRVISPLKAIILGAQPFFEKDKRLIVFTRDRGKLTVLQRRAYSGGKTMMPTEPFNIVSLQVSKGRSFYYCQQCDVVEYFSNIRRDYGALTLAWYFMEVIMKSTSTEQPNGPLFDLLESALRAIDGGTDLTVIKQRFHRYYLETEGLAEEGSQVSDSEFVQRLEQYCGRLVRIPELVPVGGMSQ